MTSFARCVGTALAFLTALAISSASAAVAPPPADRCAACHLEIGDDRLVKPAKDFPGDIHAAKGFGCVACHGDRKSVV